MNILAKLKLFIGMFLGVGIMTVIRGQVVMALVMILMLNSGTWKYFSSTMTAYDMSLATHWKSTSAINNQPVVIAIDDEGYRSFFQSRSPVSREHMLALLEVIQAHTPVNTKIAIDIDLSPVSGEELAQKELDNFFIRHAGKWVVPAVRQGDSPQARTVRTWREQMCHQGVLFGLPYVPTEFGYPKMTHQYEHGLADALIRKGDPCVDPETTLVQIPMPLLGISLDAAAVIPFSGDLSMLATELDILQPKAVMLGGMWGPNDIFGTPFGERYGVLLHNAAVAGAMNGEKLASDFTEIMMTWLFLSLMQLVLFKLCENMDRLSNIYATSMDGRVFFDQDAKPTVFVGAVFAGLYLWVTMISYLHSMTGYWINTAQVCTSAIMYTMINWNFGRVNPALYVGIGHAWDEVIKVPVLHEVDNIRRCFSLLKTHEINLHEVENGMTRHHVKFELFCASVSLFLQTIIPVISAIYLMVQVL